MKRFEFANEVAKQLITISSAIIAVVIGFYDKFFSDDNTTTFIAVVIVLLIFVFSIAMGVLSIGGLTDLVEEQEHNDWLKTTDRQQEIRGEPFKKLVGTWAQTAAKLQQGSFAGAFIFFIIIALFDHLYPSRDQGSTSATDAKQSSVTAFPARQKNDPRPIVWTQLHPDDGPNRQLIARAIVGSAEECPEARIDNEPTMMELRWRGHGPDFPIRVCEVVYDGKRVATIAGTVLGPRPLDPAHIIVLGDTGCRLAYYESQSCESANDWPLKRIADAIANLADKPDMIIHVGDYHYREKPCLAVSECGESIHGDNWRAWHADFFAPVSRLLPLAPWIMVRGNHEDCTRAGAGWRILLSPEAGTTGAKCAPDTKPYRVDFASLVIGVLDTAHAGDSYQKDKRAELYRNWFANSWPRPIATTNEPDKRDAWILLHQPLWVGFGSDCKPKEQTCTEVALSQTSAKLGTPVDWRKLGISDDEANALRAQLINPLDSIRSSLAGHDQMNASLVLSGDTHMFQMFAPKQSNLPVQIMGGMGGTALDHWSKFPTLRRQKVDADLFGTPGELWVDDDFGFAYLTKSGGTWTATYYDAGGAKKMSCQITGDKRSCEKS